MRNVKHGSLSEMPTSTVEDYLKCIFLEQQRDPEALVSMRRISTALSLAPGTVTAMVKTLADSNLVTYEPYSGVRLTPSGRQLALHVLRRHRLIELFLVKVMGMNWSEVHAEAEELEHAVSNRLIERMDEMLGYPSADPHGDPIPDIHGVVEEVVLPSLLVCEVGTPLRLARVGDQSPEFLKLLEKRSLTPGSSIQVEGRDEAADAVELLLDSGERMTLGYRAASKLFVEAAEAG